MAYNDPAGHRCHNKQGLLCSPVTSIAFVNVESEDGVLLAAARVSAKIGAARVSAKIAARVSANITDRLGLGLGLGLWL